MMNRLLKKDRNTKEKLDNLYKKIEFEKRKIEEKYREEEIKILNERTNNINKISEELTKNVENILTGYKKVEINEKPINLDKDSELRDFFLDILNVSTPILKRAQSEMKIFDLFSTDCTYNEATLWSYNIGEMAGKPKLDIGLLFECINEYDKDDEAFLSFSIYEDKIEIIFELMYDCSMFDTELFYNISSPSSIHKETRISIEIFK